MIATYRQGDLLMLFDPIKIPKGSPLAHPILIISSNRSNNYEDFYTGVMMSSTSHTDRFTFSCEDGMFDSPLVKKNCQLRMYILLSFKAIEVKGLLNRIKPIHLTAVLRQIKELVFSID